VTQRAVRKGSGATAAGGTARSYQVKAPPPRILVMLGGPGAGKGTQADVLAERLGLPHVSSGELFRAHIREGTALGKEVQRYMDRGALAPDDVTVRMISDRLGQPDAAAGVILDGFPRTVSQAQALDRMLAQGGNRVAGALYIQVDPEELVKRLSGRRVCSGTTQHIYHVMFHPPKVEGVCDVDGTPLVLRADDEPDTVRARLTKQLPPMFEVVDYYADRDLLCAIRGDQTIDQVTDALMHAVETACKVP
jgi:adenylate kinase